MIVEYIWLDCNKHFRSKARTLNNVFNDLTDIPSWSYDGSSTCQAEGTDSEITLHPVALYNCPFRGDDHRLVLCETFHRNGTPTDINTRYNANIIFKQHKEECPWYGLEQEYFIMDPKTGKPIGWPTNGTPEAQGKYYCGVGTGCVFGRDIVDKHYKYCLHAGLRISGINAEVAPGQWEFQIGPSTGISAGDQLWVGRYILERIAEEHGVEINYDPKPISGDWNGSGCHSNFSTKHMREGTMKSNGTIDKYGIEYINDGIERLSHKHAEHMAVYGDGNERRMTGVHETASYDTFSSGVSNRGCSIRIPMQTDKYRKGYLEDRRPSSNCDPYLVTSIICDTICSSNKQINK